MTKAEPATTADKPTSGVQMDTDKPKTGWRRFPVHEYADGYPLMRDDDPKGFERLVNSIKEHGLRNRVVLWRGVILDGRNRLDALEAIHGPLEIRSSAKNG